MKELDQLDDYADVNLPYYRRFIGIRERMVWFIKQVKKIGTVEEKYSLQYLHNKVNEEIKVTINTLISEDNYSIRDNLGGYYDLLLQCNRVIHPRVSVM